MSKLNLCGGLCAHNVTRALNRRAARRAIFLVTLLFAAATIAQQPTAPNWSDAENAIKRFRVEKGLKMELWAAEPFLLNPVAFGIDERGRCYVVETNRFSGGTLDIRGHMQWVERDMALRTVEERDKLQREMFAGDKHKELEQHTERLHLIEDSDGDGRADKHAVFAEDFKTSLDGVAAGVLARKGNVYFANIPNLWLLRDTTGDGKADVRTSLHYGYGVRNAFLGHDLHGLRFGPDGKLYFSIGDRAAHVTKTPDGRVVSNPECGAVFRCNADGTELEVFATGLRNPQELAFDQYGNLWTGDNNCDRGDAARLVYVVEGGDTGWRIGYQQADIPTSGGMWHAEKLWHLQNKDQPAYLNPPIAHIGSGPSGFAFHPRGGTHALANRFLITDFHGSSKGSGVDIFTVAAKGAGFEKSKTERLLNDIATTDVDVGTDGAIYVSDWVEGWGKPNKGRLYRLIDPAASSDPILAETKKLLAEGFEKRSADELSKLLAHVDMRVRQEAQFELAARGDKSAVTFAVVAKANANPLARLHAIWGLGQLAQKNPKVLASLLPLLKDADAEVRAQAAKTLGERRATDIASLVPLLKDESARVRYFAALALGKLGNKNAAVPLFDMLRENDNKDIYLRHASAMGLASLGDPKLLAATSKDASPAVRIAAVVALRKLRSPEVVIFLKDADDKVALEAARAILDVPIPAALPQLAAMINDPKCPSAMLPRVISAANRLGTPPAAAALTAFAAGENGSAKSRAEAVYALANWAKPSGRDHATGLWHTLAPREGKPASDALRPQIAKLLRDGPKDVKVEAARAAAALGVAEVRPLLGDLFQTQSSADVRLATLRALADLKDPNLAIHIVAAVADKDEKVRKLGTELQGQMPDAAVQLEKLLAAGSRAVQQTALTTLGKVNNQQADDVLSRYFDKLLVGQLPAELHLDLLEASAKKSAPAIKEKLQKYEAARPQNDPFVGYRETLVGGDAATGRQIFERQDTMCMKCHKIKGVGGDVGPDLAGIAAQKTREKLLEALLFPNKEIAPGFENVTVGTKNGVTYAGIVKSETATELTLSTPDEGVVKIAKTDITGRNKGLSAMPDDVAKKLSKVEIRHLVEYLAGLKQK